MPQLKSHVLHNRSTFDIKIITSTDIKEIFSFGVDKKTSTKLLWGRVHEICNQSKFGPLSFMPINLKNVEKIKIYQKLICVILSVIARDNPNNVLRIMYAFCSQAH